jgi:hypothetical protein
LIEDRRSEIVMPQVAVQPPETRSYTKALRLTFEYEGSTVKLVSTQKVDMILPPSHPLETKEEQSGFWFTLSDAQGKPVYRRIVNNPIRYDREVFSNDAKHPSIMRVPVKKPKGTFVMLVPDVAEARTVQLFSHPLEPEAAARGLAARELARFTITQEQIDGGKK